jgi:L-threonylcarbamoyladenylate synthase
VTPVIRVDADHPDLDALAPAAECLRRGGLVAFPTETVYGLGAHALDGKAVAAIFEAKSRPTTDPLIVHVSGLGEARSLAARWPVEADALAARFWPGPLTLVVPKAAAVPHLATAGLPSVALRCPSHPVALALLRLAGVPVAAPSANLFSRPSPTTADHVLADLDGRIDLLVDAGPTQVGVESTVVDVTGARPVVLRPGGISLEALEDALGDAVTTPSIRTAPDAALPSPGLLDMHYAPRVPMTTYEGTLDQMARRLAADARRAAALGERLGLLVVDELATVVEGTGDVRRLGPDAERHVVAARLYAALRELDALGVDRILASSVSDARGLGAAIRDRLRRAAAGRVVIC